MTMNGGGESPDMCVWYARARPTFPPGDPGVPELEDLLALAARQDAELLAVLGDGAARDVDAALLEQLDDLLVRVRALGVLARDQLLDLRLHRLRREVLAVRARDARVEEELQLEDALRRVHVLRRRHARHRRLVHADVLGDVTQDERLEMRDALVEELALELQDRLGDLDDRALALLDRSDQPLRRAQLVLDVVLARVRVAHRVLVEAADLQLRQTVVVGHHEVLVADLVDVDVGRDVVRVVARVLATGPRIEVHDDLRGLVDLLERLLQVARDRLVVLLLQVAEVALDHLDDEVVVLTARHRLDQHALGEVARADTGGLERLDRLEHLLAEVLVDAEIRGQLGERRVLEVPVGVDVAEDRHADLELLGGQRRVDHLELPRQVVVQARRLGQRRLEGRQLLAVAAERGHRRRHRVVVEVVLPVDLGDRRRVALDLGLGDAVHDGAIERGLGRAGALELVQRLLVATHLVPLATALVLEVELVVENRVLEHLLMHEVGQF